MTVSRWFWSSFSLSPESIILTTAAYLPWTSCSEEVTRYGSEYHWFFTPDHTKSDDPYQDHGLLFVVFVSKSSGDHFDHDVGLKPVVCSLLLLHLRTNQWLGWRRGTGHRSTTISNGLLHLNDLLQSRLLLLLSSEVWIRRNVLPFRSSRRCRRCCSSQSISSKDRAAKMNHNLKLWRLHKRRCSSEGPVPGFRRRRWRWAGGGGSEVKGNCNNETEIEITPG